VGRCGLDVSGLGKGPVAGFCKHGNEPSGSIKGGGFLHRVTLRFSRRTLLSVGLVTLVRHLFGCTSVCLFRCF
jgi:hypothetical protein